MGSTCYRISSTLLDDLKLLKEASAVADYQVNKNGHDYIIRVQRDGVRLTIAHDDFPDNPRYWDNVWKLICWHRRYELGDKHDFKDPRDFLVDMARQFTNLSEEEIEDKTNSELLDTLSKSDKVLIRPIYMYDHSGLSFSTNIDYPFNDPWDSGQLGWAYTTKLDEYSKDELERILEQELRVYEQYVNGQCYCFILEKHLQYDQWDVIESVGGFYGESWDDVKEAMLAHVDSQYKDLFEKAFAEL